MDNVSANASFTDNVIGIIGISAIDGVLLLIVFINTMFNLTIITALIGRDNSELVLSIRVILINILIACVLGDLSSALHHISSPILEYGTSDSSHGVPLCQAIVFLKSIGSSGRILFAAYYGVTVFIVVHYWHRPVLAPRNTKYFIIASAVVWLLAIAAGIPSLFDGKFNGLCSGSSSNMTSSHFALYTTVPYLVVSSIPIIITPISLIKTACYIKRKTIGDHMDTKKALVKFGLFLMIIQGVNSFAQIVVPLLTLLIGHLIEFSLAFIIGITLSDLSRIPTTVLIIIFFKPVRVKVKRWICCCIHGRKRATMNRIATNSSATTHA